MASIADINDDLQEEIEARVSTIASAATVVDIGDEFEYVAEGFQAMAISHLLAQFDAKRFRRHLVHSGYTLRYLLKRAKSERNTDANHIAISRTQAFFNTVCAGHYELATEIVALSPHDWMPDGEYEDDFCYMQFMHRVATTVGEVDREFLGALLERFESVLAGAPSARLTLCRALLDRSAEEFTEAFDAMLVEHDQWVKDNERFRGWDVVFLARARLFVEGLAILSIADRLGYPTRKEYLFCPAVGRLPATTDWPPDFYEEIERIAAEDRAAG